MNESSFPLGGREVVLQALSENLTLLQFINASEDAIVNAEEMVECASEPYDPKKAQYGVDTLDRHPWSCYGNNAELVVALCLYHYGWIQGEDLAFERGHSEQVDDKIDLVTHSFNVQVKTASRGNDRDGRHEEGQLFISKTDLEGKANYVAYVDGKRRVILMINRAKFLDEIVALDCKLPADRWKGNSGWFRHNGRFPESTFEMMIPAPICTTYYNADEQEIRLRRS